MKVMKQMVYGMATLCLAASMTARAAYPEREIRMVVPYGAGGSTDVAIRVLAKALEPHLGQSIVVENRPGAQATLGPAYVARQPADGYTIGVITMSTVAIAPHMVRTPYTLDDFSFIGGFARYRYGLAVNADAPYQTLQAFVDAARTQPMFFAVPGAPNNLAFFELANKYGAKLEQVLYKSGAEAVTAVAAGQAQATIQPPADLMAQVDAGRIRLLASVSPARWHDRPDMATMREQGFDVAIESWAGLAVPRNTAPEIRAQLEAALRQASETPELRDRLNALGMDPVWATGAEYERMMRDGYVTMRTRLQEAGMPVLPKE